MTTPVKTSKAAPSAVPITPQGPTTQPTKGKGVPDPDADKKPTTVKPAATPTTPATKGKGVPKKGETKATPTEAPKKTPTAAPKPNVEPTQGKGIPNPGEPNNTPNHQGRVFGRSKSGKADKAYSELDAVGSGDVNSQSKDDGATKSEGETAKEQG